MLNESSFSRDTLTLVLAAADEDDDAEKQDDYEKMNLMKKYLEMLAETAETNEDCNIRAKIAKLLTHPNPGMCRLA